MMHCASNPVIRLIRLRLTALAGVLFAAGACAQGLVVKAGQASWPARTINSEGVEIFSGGEAKDLTPAADTVSAPAAKSLGAANPPLTQPPHVIDKRSGSAAQLVSPRLVALPGQVAVVRAVDPRRADERFDDGRIEILTQELTKESQELINKQRLLRLPAGQDPLADALRERIKQEVRQHEQNITGLYREMNLLVRQQQHAHARF